MLRRTFLARKRGIDFLHNRFTNKGTAFTQKERDYLSITGLVPPGVDTLDEQVARCWYQFNQLKVPINRYQMLKNLQDENVTLYYALINAHIMETMPIIYTPVVGEACQRYGPLYVRDHGIYVPSTQKGNIKQLLRNTKKEDVNVIVVSDGSRILGLGDQGSGGMGIPIGKCALYVAGAGVHPGKTLPMMLDVGTNRQDLINDPFYLGQRSPRLPDDQFYAITDELMEAVKEVYPTTVLQFEDFSNNHCFDLLERYINNYRTFNDDIQGTGAVVAAGFVNAIRASGLPADKQRIAVFGAGSAAVGVVQAIADLVEMRFGVPQAVTKKNVYLVDSRGLVTDSRGGKLEKHKLAWSRKDVSKEDSSKLISMMDVVKHFKPTALLGLGGVGPVFTQEMCEYMCTYCENPIIFPLSNPSSKAEVIPDEAFKWTKGKCIVASGSPFLPSYHEGRMFKPSQGNNMYVFPGIGLGCAMAQPHHIPQSVFVAASKCLMDLVTEDMLNVEKILYPPLPEIRMVSQHIATAVIEELRRNNLVGTKGLPEDHSALLKLVRESQWQPVYGDALKYPISH